MSTKSTIGVKFYNNNTGVFQDIKSAESFIDIIKEQIEEASHYTVASVNQKSYKTCASAFKGLGEDRRWPPEIIPALAGRIESAPLENIGREIEMEKLLFNLKRKFGWVQIPRIEIPKTYESLACDLWKDYLIVVNGLTISPNLFLNNQDRFLNDFPAENSNYESLKNKIIKTNMQYAKYANLATIITYLTAKRGRDVMVFNGDKAYLYKPYVEVDFFCGAEMEKYTLLDYFDNKTLQKPNQVCFPSTFR